MPGEPQMGVPSMETLCERYGVTGGLYYVYRLLSQPIHGTKAGASTFHVETREALAELGQGTSEWVDSEFVSLPMAAIWEAASIAAGIFRDLLAPDHELPGLDRKVDFDAELSKVPANIGWKAAQPGLPAAEENIGPPRLNRAQRRRLAKLKRRQRGTK